jgi:hypothetical protein
MKRQKQSVLTELGRLAVTLAGLLIIFGIYALLAA